MWTAFISNNKNWTSIFGENYSPKNLRISYAILKDQSITLKLNSSIEFNNTPPKWIAQGYNEFEFDLLLNQIKSINISNFNFYGPICITVEKKPIECEINIKISDTCTITCQSNDIFVSNINAYQNDRSE